MVSSFSVKGALCVIYTAQVSTARNYNGSVKFAGSGFDSIKLLNSRRNLPG